MNHLRGDLLKSVRTGIILQQVNAQGVMRSGIAAAIRARWPQVWTAYAAEVPASLDAGSAGAQHLGKLIPVQVEPNLWVLNLVGQQFYGRDGKRYTSYDALDTALAAAGRFAAANGLTSENVHHPLLGCGLGGGHWPVVKALIEHRVGPETTLWTLD